MSHRQGRKRHSGDKKAYWNVLEVDIGNGRGNGFAVHVTMVESAELHCVAIVLSRRTTHGFYLS